MRRAAFVVAFVGVAAVPAARAATIQGDYIEARTADVYTGPCFANGEVNLVGKEATIAWRVTRGAWDGVALDGLAVVGVVRTDATLGDPFETPRRIRARLYVDARADARQRRALADLARSLGGRLLSGAGNPTALPITLDIDRPAGFADLKAGAVAEIKTRSFCHHDKHCGNEEVFYEPLTSVKDPVAAFTLVNEFHGDGLGATWAANDARSAFLARFER